MIFVIGTGMIVIAGVLGMVLSVKKAQRRKGKMINNKEKRKKLLGGSPYKTPMYKPKMLTQEDLAKNMKESLASKKEKPWGPQKVGSYPTLQRTPQKSLFQTQLPIQEPEPEIEPEEDEPYWKADEWEDWAYQIYLNYPEVRQFLPDWFMKALEEQMSQQK